MAEASAPTVCHNLDGVRKRSNRLPKFVSSCRLATYLQHHACNDTGCHPSASASGFQLEQTKDNKDEDSVVINRLGNSQRQNDKNDSFPSTSSVADSGHQDTYRNTRAPAVAVRDYGASCRIPDVHACRLWRPLFGQFTHSPVTGSSVMEEADISDEDCDLMETDTEDVEELNEVLGAASMTCLDEQRRDLISPLLISDDVRSSGFHKDPEAASAGVEMPPVFDRVSGNPVDTKSYGSFHFPISGFSFAISGYGFYNFPTYESAVSSISSHYTGRDSTSSGTSAGLLSLVSVWNGDELSGASAEPEATRWGDDVLSQCSLEPGSDMYENSEASIRTGQCLPDNIQDRTSRNESRCCVITGNHESDILGMEDFSSFLSGRPDSEELTGTEQPLSRVCSETRPIAATENSETNRLGLGDMTGSDCSNEWSVGSLDRNSLITDGANSRSSSTRLNLSSSSTSSSSDDNWYYYDRRVRQNVRSRRSRVFCASLFPGRTEPSPNIISPPSYDDVLSRSTTVHDTSPVNDALRLVLAPEDPPPPYPISDLPPAYDPSGEHPCGASGTELDLFAVVPEPPPRYVSNVGLPGRRPPVRWNSGMRIDRWTSLDGWTAHN